MAFIVRKGQPFPFPLDDYGDPRDYAAEARAILAGTVPLLPQLEHLQALDEVNQCQAIKFALALERMRKRVLDGEPL